MQVVILEKEKELAESLKRAISLRYSCLIDSNFSIEQIEKKYRGTKSTFILGESINEKERINEEGLKLAYLIKDRLNLKIIVIGLGKEERKIGFPYLKIPFQLSDIYEAISTAYPAVKRMDKNILLDKYEHLRTKISHDYIQYITKNWAFYKFLVLNFINYSKIIFGINLEDQGLDEDKIKEIIKRYENQRDPSILHNLLMGFKVSELKNYEIIDFPELKCKFFKNLDMLISILGEKIKFPFDLEERIAENFFLSWYLWRELFFLEKYSQYFSDGFYKGCFRSLLSFHSPHFDEIKKKTLKSVLFCQNISKAKAFLSEKRAELERLFK